MKWNQESRRRLLAAIGKIHKCNNCQYFSRYYFSVINHVRRYLSPPVQQFDCFSPIDVFSCRNCQFQHHLKVIFKRHSLKNKLGIKARKYKCLRCNYESNSFLLLGKHRTKCFKAKARPYKCTKCNFSSTWNLALDRHKKRRHSVAKKTRLKCTKCCLRFASTASLQFHNRIKHSKNVTIHQCSYCGHKTPYMGNLKAHIKRMHLNEEKLELEANSSAVIEKKTEFVCEPCDFKTGDEAAFNNHNNQHVKCQRCNFVTTEKKTLFKHNKLKHGKMYQCSECEYESRHQSNLSIHRKNMHMPDFWLNCANCEFKCKQKYFLKKHIAAKGH